MLTEKQKAGTGKLELMRLAILVALTLCIGAYLFVTTAVIERDGVTFIEYAKGLERDVRATIQKEDQHPGYPAMILAAHRAALLSGTGDSLMTWVYSAQSVTLFFRVVAIIPLYFIGRRMVGVRGAFVGGLLIAILPAMAEYGSDALSDWPNLFFLACGLLFLMKASSEGKWWLFGPAGMCAGAGYLIRPETAIVVAIGGLWVVWQVLAARDWSRGRAFAAGLVLVVGFAFFAGPYMGAKGALFPKKHVGEFSVSTPVAAPKEAGHSIIVKVLKAAGKLGGRVSEVLMWFFVPAFVIGAVEWFRRREGYPVKFLIASLLAINVAIMLWLHVRHGYISRRHILGMMAITVFLVPAGIDSIAGWLAGRRFWGVSRNNWVAVLLLAGAAICLVKLWGLADSGKGGYIEAAKWLKANTTGSDVIATPDPRIAFYAERKWIPSSEDGMPAGANYVVKTWNGPKSQENGGQIEPAFVFRGKKKGQTSIAIYRTGQR